MSHIHAIPFDFHRPTYFGWMSKFKSIGFKDVKIKNSDNKYCCLINLITSQINASIVFAAKKILAKKANVSKNIAQGDASPENKNSKKIKNYVFCFIFESY